MRHNNISEEQVKYIEGCIQRNEVQALASALQQNKTLSLETYSNLIASAAMQRKRAAFDVLFSNAPISRIGDLQAPIFLFNHWFKIASAAIVCGDKEIFDIFCDKFIAAELPLSSDQWSNLILKAAKNGQQYLQGFLGLLGEQNKKNLQQQVVLNLNQWSYIMAADGFIDAQSVELLLGVFDQQGIWQGADQFDFDQWAKIIVLATQVNSKFFHIILEIFDHKNQPENPIKFNQEQWFEIIEKAVRKGDQEIVSLLFARLDQQNHDNQENLVIFHKLQWEKIIREAIDRGQNRILILLKEKLAGQNIFNHIQWHNLILEAAKINPEVLNVVIEWFDQNSAAVDSGLKVRESEWWFQIMLDADKISSENLVLLMRRLDGQNEELILNSKAPIVLSADQWHKIIVKFSCQDPEILGFVLDRFDKDLSMTHQVKSLAPIIFTQQNWSRILEKAASGSNFNLFWHRYKTTDVNKRINLTRSMIAGVIVAGSSNAQVLDVVFESEFGDKINQNDYLFFFSKDDWDRIILKAVSGDEQIFRRLMSYFSRQIDNDPNGQQYVPFANFFGRATNLGHNREEWLNIMDAAVKGGSSHNLAILLERFVIESPFDEVSRRRVIIFDANQCREVLLDSANFSVFAQFLGFALDNLNWQPSKDEVIILFKDFIAKSYNEVVDKAGLVKLLGDINSAFPQIFNILERHNIIERHNIVEKPVRPHQKYEQLEGDSSFVMLGVEIEQDTNFESETTFSFNKFLESLQIILLKPFLNIIGVNQKFRQIVFDIMERGCPDIFNNSENQSDEREESVRKKPRIEDAQSSDEAFHTLGLPPEILEKIILESTLPPSLSPEPLSSSSSSLVGRNRNVHAGHYD